MKGKFECRYVGRTEEPSKNGKYKYLFVQGDKKPEGIMNQTPVEFWSDELFDCKFMEAYPLILDVQGDFVNFVAFAK